MDLLFPTWVPIAEAEWRLVDFTGRSSTTASGAQRRVSRGQRLGVSYRLQNLSAAERHAVMAWAAALRGGFGTAILYDPANRQRGSFPGGELLANPTFADGTTGWTSSGGAQLSFTTQARVAVLKPLGLTQPGIYQQPTFTQGVPYAVRSFLRDGLQSAGLSIGRFLSDSSSASIADYNSTRGLGTLSFVAGSTGVGTAWAYVMAATSGYVPGQISTFLDYTSLARCALVDNGPNLLTYGDDVTNGVWTPTGLASRNSNVAVAPDGTTTADSIVENSSTGYHTVERAAVTVSASAADYSFTVAVKGGRNFVLLELAETLGSTGVYQVFNLSTGAVGATTFTGANWSNKRAFITALGNGWYACTLIARKTNAATGVVSRIYIENADTSATYTGDGTSLLWVWRATLAQSSVPTRLVSTTTTAAAGTGSAGIGYAYLKGLPASTSGLVAAGDRVEVNGEMKIATASLDSDAAGLGYLQFEPVLRTAPADGAAVIIGQPMGRFILTDDASWVTRPGMFSDIILNFIEA